MTMLNISSRRLVRFLTNETSDDIKENFRRESKRRTLLIFSVTFCDRRKDRESEYSEFSSKHEQIFFFLCVVMQAVEYLVAETQLLKELECPAANRTPN